MLEKSDPVLQLKRPSRQDLRTSRGLLKINCARYDSGVRPRAPGVEFRQFFAREGFCKLIANEPVQDVLSPRVTGYSGVERRHPPSPILIATGL